MKHLSSASDNELLNVAEVTTESMPASAAKMLCKRMFGMVPDASDPHFLPLISHLTYSSKQQTFFSSRSLEDLGDSLRETFLMVNYLLS